MIEPPTTTISAVSRHLLQSLGRDLCVNDLRRTTTGDLEQLRRYLTTWAHRVDREIDHRHSPL